MAALQEEMIRRGIQPPVIPIKKPTRFKDFQERYHYDPKGFVLDAINFPRGEEPTPYQLEILRELPIRKRVCVRGPHTSGKTCLAAWVILWGILTDVYDDCKIPNTASAWRQLTFFLWPEVHKWAARLKWEVIGRPPFREGIELGKQSLATCSTTLAFPVASNQAALIEGAHAKRIIYIYDEAKVIPDETWDATEGAFAGAGDDTAQEAFALAISTPGEPIGRFYAIHARQYGVGEWWTRHVTLEEGIAAGRISREWATNRLRDWGENDPRYQNRVLGEFASSMEDGIIPLIWIEAANERWLERMERGEIGSPVTVGVDVGAGGDKSVIAPWDGQNIITLIKSGKADTMETTGRVISQMRPYGFEPVPIVDGIGIGAGVVGRLRELEHLNEETGEWEGLSVIPFIAGAKTGLLDATGEFGFADWRSAAWWTLREMLDPDGGDDVGLPPDDELEGELMTPRWREMSNGRLKVESKGRTKSEGAGVTARLGRSTNCADAVVMAIAGKQLQKEKEEREKKDPPPATAPAIVTDLRDKFT